MTNLKQQLLNKETFDTLTTTQNSPSEEILSQLEEGIKFDTNKLRWDLLPFTSLTAVTEVMTYGANKYAERNWEKGMRFTRVFASTMRHLTAWFIGEDKDPETKMSHLAHAACNILFLLHYELTTTGTDDRPVQTEVK